MNNFKEWRYFWLLAVAIFFFFGIPDYLHLGPFGMHQGAQSDRASIALNFFQNSMNFFEPRVMENRSFHGVTGMEFPIIPYAVAILYKLFGYHPIWYRGIEWLLFIAGQAAIWNISRFFIAKISHRILFQILWLSSPILIFYGPNFLPEVPALSFSLMAWYQLFKYYYQIEIKKSYRLFLLFSTLAALIKITYLVPLITLLVVLLYQKKLAFQGFPNPKKLLLGLIIPLLAVLIWYSYSRYLTQRTYNQHFLQQINPPHNISEFLENSRYALNTWIDSLYPRQFAILFVLIWLFTLQKRYKNMSLIGFISIFLFLGFLGIFILFNRQFRYHDYYFVSAIPFCVFGLLYLYEEHVAHKSMFSGLIGILVVIGLYISPFLNATHTRKQVRATHKVGDYYCQNILNNTADFERAKNFIEREFGPGELIVAFDPSPNTFLYYLGRQGIRIAPDFDEILSVGIIQAKLDEKTLAKPYIIINKFFEYPQEHYIHKLIEEPPLFQNGEVWIFKLNAHRFEW